MADRASALSRGGDRSDKRKTNVDLTKEGYLTKRGHVRKNWKLRTLAQADDGLCGYGVKKMGGGLAAFLGCGLARSSVFRDNWSMFSV